jgi:hypothetical protein
MSDIDIPVRLFAGLEKVPESIRRFYDTRNIGALYLP